MNVVGENDKFKDKGFDIIVKIAPDFLSASITIDIFSENAVVKISDLESALHKENVSFGINSNLLQQIADEPSRAKEIVVAKGVPFIHGEDGKIEYKFDYDIKSKPSIKEDGSVNFKETNFFVPVKRGQVLAVRTLPTEGKKGTLVTGKIMSGRNGEIKNFKIGNNVFISDDGLSVISSVDGSVNLENGEISVTETLNIDGDVGVETGNINFSGNINISGNVRTGFYVRSNEDVVVRGLVEGATIEAGGNLTINMGIQGNDQAFLKVGGDLVAKFINSATVQCERNVSADAIMHSNVTSNEFVKACGKRGVIFGGDIYGRKGVFAKQIGSDMGTKTSVRTGFDSKMQLEVQKLTDQKAHLIESIEKVDQVINLLSKQSKLENDGSNITIIKKSLATKKEYKKELKEIIGALKDYAALFEELKKSVIKTGDIYPGVRLKLDNSFFSVKDRMVNSKFIRVGGEIKIVGFDNKF